MRRIVGEMAVLVAAIVVAVGVAWIIAPGDFPDAGGEDFGVEKNRFYNRLFWAQLAGLAVGIVGYWLIRKVYRRYGARQRAEA